ncbi:MAG TPA: hypothetical protein VMV46_23510 [Thermoanaerobaculia bacterium]|nr:hypothetical protein [Thermoanaerobaculia bacterium]
MSPPEASNAATVADVPELPAPWRPVGELPEEGRPPRAGCVFPALLGCGCVGVLVATGLALMVANARPLLEWQLRPLRTAVLEGLPASVAATDRQRLVAAFDALPAALTSGAADPGAVWRFQRLLAETAAAAQAETLDRDGALALLAAIEEITGTEPATELRTAPRGDAPVAAGGPR